MFRLYNKHLSTATETVGVERFLQRGNLVGSVAMATYHCQT